MEQLTKENIDEVYQLLSLSDQNERDNYIFPQQHPEDVFGKKKLEYIMVDNRSEEL